MAIWVFHGLELGPSHFTLGYSPVHAPARRPPPGPIMPCSSDAPCLCVSYSLPLLLGNGYSSCKMPPMCICPWETSSWHPGAATRPAFGCLLPCTTFYYSSYPTSGQLCLCPALSLSAVIESYLSVCASQCPGLGGYHGYQSGSRGGGNITSTPRFYIDRKSVV